MALRQQQQIDTQHQLLAAKQQRLRFLKAQEVRSTSSAAEGERLRRLRERVETQESKLRRLRALRGQVDLQKTYNVTLSEYYTLLTLLLLVKYRKTHAFRFPVDSQKFYICSHLKRPFAIRLQKFIFVIDVVVVLYHRSSSYSISNTCVGVGFEELSSEKYNIKKHLTIDRKKFVAVQSDSTRF